MSISNLLVPNHYNLEVNSIYTAESFSLIPLAASQVLSTVAPTQLVINLPLVNTQVANGHVILSPTSYTAPATGVYHFGGSVQIVYGVTLADKVSQTVSIIANGVTLLYQSNDQRDIAAAGSVSVILPLNVYLPLTAGDVITVRVETPVSVVGAGNFTLNAMTKQGTMWYGNRG